MLFLGRYLVAEVKSELLEEDESEDGVGTESNERRNETFEESHWSRRRNVLETCHDTLHNRQLNSSLSQPGSHGARSISSTENPATRSRLTMVIYRSETISCSNLAWPENYHKCFHITVHRCKLRESAYITSANPAA